jgi:hypothetical protein
MARGGRAPLSQLAVFDRQLCPVLAVLGRAGDRRPASWLKGALPPRAMRMVQEWRELHAGELRENWHRVQRSEPPVRVEPLP